MLMKKKNKCIVTIAALTLMLVASPCRADDQPTSTITPSGDQYAAYNDPSDTISYSTSEVPEPQCPNDSPTGDPDYFWEFGPLDGTDNADGSATINSTKEGSFKVTVFCSQEFTDSDGNAYTESTQPSE